jgi:hypothetical protein
MRRLYAMTESLKHEMESFKRQAEEKEKAKTDEVRTLQAAMGDMCAENAALKEENDSKPSL